MDQMHPNPQGEYPTPIFSIRQNYEWISYNSLPSSIPPNAMDFWKTRLRQDAEGLLPRANGNLKDYELAWWYDPVVHWLAWAPMRMPGSVESPLSFLFEDVRLDIEHSTVTVDEDGQEVREVSGYFISDEWKRKVCGMAEQLHEICQALAGGNDFYAASPDSPFLGDTPKQLDEAEISHIFYHAYAAEEVIAKTRRDVLSCLGFVSWMSATGRKWDNNLRMPQRAYVKSLKLQEHPAVGALFKLSRDYHEMNFVHLARNNIPFHYVWTPEEAEERRFVRYSPEFLREVIALENGRGGAAVQAHELPSHDKWRENLRRYDFFGQDKFSERRGFVLHDFEPWYKYKIVDFMGFGARPIENWKMIRSCAERFKCTMRKARFETIITFWRQTPLRESLVPPVRHHWPLTKFAEGEYGHEVDENEAFNEDPVLVLEKVKNKWAPRPGRTFNPYDGRRDGPRSELEPWEREPEEAQMKDRVAHYLPQEGSVGVAQGASWRSPDHRPTLEERMGLASTEYSTRSPPSDQMENTDVYYQRASDVGKRRRASRSLSPRQGSRARHVYSPRPRSLSPQGAGELEDHGEEGALTDQGSNEIAFTEPGESFTQEYGSYAPSDNEDDEEAVFEDATEEIPTEQAEEDAPRTSENPRTSSSSAREEYVGQFATENDAIDALAAFWSKIFVESVPPRRGRENLHWNQDWMDVAMFVFKDPRTHLRMKMICNLRDDVDTMEDVLNLAWRWAMPFQLFIPQASARNFSSSSVDDLDSLVLPTMYDVGYQETFMTYGNGGAPAYARYGSSARGVLNRPNAVGFIFEGGILSILAQVMCPDLIFRCAQGPSIQVSEFSKGETFLQRNPPNGEMAQFWTADRVSAEEILLLIGHVPTGHPSTDLSLFPHPDLLEEQSQHFRGMIGMGAHRIIEGLLRDIDRKKYIWRTASQWTGYLRRNNHGTGAPVYTPADADFDEAGAVMKRSYPVTWQQTPLRDIEIPETFDPRAYRY